MRHARIVLAIAAVALGLGSASRAAELEDARIYIEYNFTDNDLGYHVFLDGEDWNTLSIINPDGLTIFRVEGLEAYEELGLTELFFEGAEPSLTEVPLDELLGRFPEGEYQFSGATVDGEPITGTGTLTHAVPAGFEVSARLHGRDKLTISWTASEGTPEGFPEREVEIVGYQVIVGSFQVTLPGDARQVRVPPEFVQSLEAGEHGFEVLAIEAGGNQTIAAGDFVKGSEEQALRRGAPTRGR